MRERIDLLVAIPGRLRWHLHDPKSQLAKRCTWPGRRGGGCGYAEAAGVGVRGCGGGGGGQTWPVPELHGCVLLGSAAAIFLDCFFTCTH